MSNGLQIFKKSSLCKWIFGDFLYLIYLLMIRIPIYNLWTKNMSIMSYTKVFDRNFLRTSEKISHFKVESSPFCFRLICTIFWKKHIQLARCKFMVLWNNTIHSPPKFFLINVWIIYKNVLFLLILHILILIAFWPQLLSCFHICQKFFTTHWIIKV